MRIAIVEDEALIARRLERMVRTIVGTATVHIASSYAMAVDVTRQPLDLLFLDLKLNGRDGFRLLEETAASKFPTIVVSAHHELALRAFEYGVADFVAKPWTEERLRRAIERVRAGALSSPCTTVIVRKGRELRTLDTGQIVYVRAADDYSELHLAGGSVHLHEKSLTALESLLPDIFERVHRSYIANLQRARGLRSEGLMMWDGSLVPVGRLYRPTLRRRLFAAQPAPS